MQDFTGVPAIVDLATMRDVIKKMGGDPERSIHYSKWILSSIIRSRSISSERRQRSPSMPTGNWSGIANDTSF